MSESLPPAPKDSPREDEETKAVNPWRKRVSYLLALGLLALFFLPNILNNDDATDVPYQGIPHTSHFRTSGDRTVQ